MSNRPARTTPDIGTASTSATLHAASTPLLTKLAIAKVSEDLVNSQAKRQQFIADPAGFLEWNYGVKPSAEEEDYFRDMAGRFADGWCCGGCACGAPDPGAMASRPR